MGVLSYHTSLASSMRYVMCIGRGRGPRSRVVVCSEAMSGRSCVLVEVTASTASTTTLQRRRITRQFAVTKYSIRLLEGGCE